MVDKISLDAKTFESMTNQAKEEGLEIIIKTRKILETQFENATKFPISKEVLVKELNSTYNEMIKTISLYEKSFGKYLEQVKEEYLPLIEDHEDKMKN